MLYGMENLCSKIRENVDGNKEKLLEMAKKKIFLRKLYLLSLENSFFWGSKDVRKTVKRWDIF